MKFFIKPMIVLVCILWLIPARSHSGYISLDRITTYQINFDLNWIQKFLIFFKNLECVSWKEATLQELFIKYNNDLKIDNESELVIASITPKNFNEAMALKNAGEREGFWRFVKYEKLSPEGVQKLLEIINYVYIPAEGRVEFLNVNLLEKNPDKYLMNWVITKKKFKDRYLIDIQLTVFNDQNPKKGGAAITAVLNPLEKIFEEVKIEIKNGPKLKLIRKPVS